MHRTTSQQKPLSINSATNALQTVVYLMLALTVSATPVQASEIQIRDLEDIDFGVVPPTVGDLRADAEFCVVMTPRGRYSVIAKGDGPGGRFSIIETGTGVHSIDYTVQISDRGRRFGRVLRPGVAMNNLRASRQRFNGRCRPPARIRVVVRGTELESAHPGRYEGTLSLMVVPE